MYGDDMTPNRKPKTLAQRFRACLFANVAIVSATAALGVAAYASAPHQPDRPALDVMDSPADIAARYDCWTGEAPADVTVPGHVVVTHDGSVLYAGERMVGKALAQTFDGAEHGLIVHAFCR